MLALGSILQLPIISILVGERVGFYHPDHAARLGESMKADGQHDPIHVRANGNRAVKQWTLVAGLHRLRGAEMVGLATIMAIQVADASSDALTLKRLELSENIDRRQFRAIERAIFLTAIAEIAQAEQHGDFANEARGARAARVRWQGTEEFSTETVPVLSTLMLRSRAADATNWDEAAAAIGGCSVRTLSNYRRLHRSIVVTFPDLAQRLNDHPLGESLRSMVKIAGIAGEPGRRRVIEIILDDPAISSVDEAMVRAEVAESHGNRRASADDRRWKSVQRHWSSMSPRAQQTYFPELLEASTPSVRKFMAECLRAHVAATDAEAL